MTKHVHYDLIMQYAEDWAETDKPLKRWQFKDLDSKWEDFKSSHPSWDDDCEYRRKPQTRTVNGFTFEW